MNAAYSILHISDFHRPHVEAITNQELISALVADRINYTSIGTFTLNP